MKRELYTLLSLATLLLTTGCNYREYCNDYTYEEHARVKYIWEESKATVIPELLNIEFGAGTRAGEGIFESANDYYDLALPYGDYSSFAWNPTENVDVKNRTFYAQTNPDGSLKSVGELYSGGTDFRLRAPEEIEQDEIKEGNAYVDWNSRPYHGEGENRIFYKEVPIIMKPQTREIRIVLDIANNDIEYIKSITSSLAGICQSKDADGNYISSGNINLVFTQEGNQMIATYRVLGCMPEMPQKVDLDITFTDDTKSQPISVNITDGLTSFNEGFGEERVTIPIQLALDVRNEDNQLKFAVIIQNWEDVTSGDNDLEIESE